LSFEGIQDIGTSLQRAELQGLLSGEELLAIATTLAGARQLRRIIDFQSDVPTLKELAAQLRTYPELEQEIHRCIDDRAQVADRATPKLAGIRVQMRQLRDRIYQILQGILQRQSNAVQEQLITQRSGRFVIPVKAPQKDAIPGIVHDSSASGATLYVEPHSTVNLNNQMRQLLRQEQAEEEAVRRALTEQVAAVKPDLDRLLVVVTTLDLAAAKARYSFWLQANPPKFIELGEPELAPKNPETEDEEKEDEENSENSQLLIRNLRSQITLRQLRHPLLVWQQQHEQGFPVVPVDLTIGPHIRVVAITGPNTGGKTVTLKTLGLAALMAKAGMFVAAREPVELPWFDNILADIGDEQSLQQSLSTFSGHIRRISRILEVLHNKSQAQGEENSNLSITNFGYFGFSQYKYAQYKFPSPHTSARHFNGSQYKLSTSAPCPMPHAPCPMPNSQIFSFVRRSRSGDRPLRRQCIGDRPVAIPRPTFPINSCNYPLWRTQSPQISRLPL
jgi:DNA mismatch repair protein MutS2